MKKENKGIRPLIFAIAILILLALLIVVYVQDVNRRNSQISAFKEFAENNGYPLNTGTVSFRQFLSQTS